MFSSRRLAKRSIIGTRVCCLWQDGRFYPGIIKAHDQAPAGDDRYTIRFEDGFTSIAFDKDIIGPGFQSVSNVNVKHAQKVFITHNGREVCGVVVKHDRTNDDVYILIKSTTNGQDIEVVRKLEDVRLLESRKSARLQDQDTDYSRLADFHPEPKKRAVSHVIDVPIPAAKQSRRRKSSSSSPDLEEPMMTEDDMEEDKDKAVMDENMAAMVLTSLSCSPVSPQFPVSFQDKDSIDTGTRYSQDFLLFPGSTSPGVSSSYGSSGVFTVKSQASTPSPPQHLSTSAPHGGAALFGTPSSVDEGIGLDDTHDYFMEDVAPKRKRPSTRTVFKCTWPGCAKIYNTNAGIEKHVREEHLGPKETSDSDLSDHEEEFYYTEVEVSVDTVTETFADMYTSSPPQATYIQAARSIQDHDYQKKEPRSLPQNIPGRKSGSDYGSFPQMAAPHSSHVSRSWGTAASSPLSPPIRITKSGSQGSARGHSLSSSPKSSPMHKKSRSEVKKCRKVYGMENRDLWCTQCKWKKACSRFNE